MTLHKRLGSACGIFALITTTFLSIGCDTSAVHPNQLSQFDGGAYDALTLAQGALTSLRASISQDFPSFSPAYNDAAKAYNETVEAYTIYRNTQSELGVSASLKDLTLAVVLLETALETDMRVPPAKDAQVRRYARQVRSRAAQAHINVSDILTELQIAAAIAQTVPAAQPYSKLATAVINSTTLALNAEQALSGKPIDLGTLHPILPIL